MQNQGTSEFSLAVTAIGIGVGKMVEFLVQQQNVLASISYLVAIVAGLITIYYKFKRKG